MSIIKKATLLQLQSHSLAARYAVAVASVILMLVFRSLLHPILGDKNQYIIFLLPVLVTAWYSGSEPALLALVLGAITGNIFFDQPYFRLKLGDLSDALAVSFYLIIGMAVVYLFDLVKRHEAQLAAQILKQAEVENALRLSEERFRLATEALQGVIYDWDAATDMAYRSPGLFEILGYQVNEIIDNRKWWRDQIHPEDFERVQQAHQKSIAEHVPIHSIEYRVRHRDGYYIWVWDNSRIIYNAEGQVIRLIGTTLSIDERKRLAESLTQTEERFRVAFENASDAMAISDQDGLVVAANEAYFQLYGYTAEEVIGHNFAIIFPEAEREQVIERYHRIFNNQHELPFYESIVQRKDGSERTVEAHAGFVAQHGRRMYMLSVIRDLTERKKTEKELYARYQLTADLAHAVSLEDVGRVTVEHIIKYLGATGGNIFVYRSNDNMFEMLYKNPALSSEELASWHSFPANPDYPLTDVVKHSQSLWFSTTEARETAYPSTKQFSRPDLGSSVLLPLVVASDVFGVISMMFSEIRTFAESEKVFVESLVFQCAQAIERARLAEKAQELAVIQERHRLARDLHDTVSQLLFSSSVISEMLPRLLKSQPEKALKQVDQLHVMVRGAMAEMRSLLWELRPESIIQTQLSTLLTHLSDAVRARQEVEISVTIRVENEFILPPDAQVAFYRIAQESVHNVLKHSQASVISIWLRQSKDYTALIVLDDGSGFDIKAAGSGLGLRNMQERAVSVGATFDIKSKIGKGTRIRLLLPVQKANAD